MKKIFFLVSLLAIVALLPLAYFAIQNNVWLLRNHYPILERNLASQSPHFVLHKQRPEGWVPLEEVSWETIGAVIVSEDWKFFEHHGFDLDEIQKAIKLNWQNKKYLRGASTISQQLARNIFLTKEKNLWRKFKEMLLTLWLEQTLSKEMILEHYLNIAEWGGGVRGISAAALYYFDKHPSELTAKEGAFLAMLLPNPRRYNQSFRQKRLTAYAQRTIKDILHKMAVAGYIDHNQATLEAAYPLAFEAQTVSAL